MLTLQSALCTTMSVVGTPRSTMVPYNKMAPRHITTLMWGLVSLMYLQTDEQKRLLNTINRVIINW